MSNITPAILKETSSGFIKNTIKEEMFYRREIECMGEITSELAASLILQLRYLYHQSPEDEITMYINSQGGDVSCGLAVYDMMKAVKCPIRTVCVATAASMAAVLFLSGNTREMMPHSKVMIHDPLILGTNSVSALQLDHISHNLMETREIIGNIISLHTGHSLEEVYEKTAIDSYFNAEESIAWGLADSIITKMQSGNNETIKLQNERGR